MYRTLRARVAVATAPPAIPLYGRAYMIRNIRHKGLRAFYDEDDPRGLSQNWLKRIKIILTRLEASTKPSDMDLPGLRLHLLKGDLKGFYAVDVSGNWRIVFRFDGEDAVDVDLVDYH